MTCIKWKRQWKCPLFNVRFIFITVGLTCISKHDDFEATVLLKSTVWTALVALHDWESCGLEKRNDITNRQQHKNMFLLQNLTLTFKNTFGRFFFVPK